MIVSHVYTLSVPGISFNQYLTYLPVPVLPTPECNSSSLYNGHVADSMLCSMANGDSRVCHVRDIPAAYLSFKRTFAKFEVIQSQSSALIM